MPRPTHLPLFHQPNKSWQGLQTIKLLLVTVCFLPTPVTSHHLNENTSLGALKKKALNLSRKYLSLICGKSSSPTCI
jgi:hypothetical protein